MRGGGVAVAIGAPAEVNSRAARWRVRGGSPAPFWCFAVGLGSCVALLRLSERRGGPVHGTPWHSTRTRIGSCYCEAAGVCLWGTECQWFNRFNAQCIFSIFCGNCAGRQAGQPSGRSQGGGTRRGGPARARIGAWRYATSRCVLVGGGCWFNASWCLFCENNATQPTLPGAALLAAAAARCIPQAGGMAPPGS